jgi:excinuclease ABC subunit A
MANIELPCEACNSKRFKAETLEILFQSKSISDILEMTIDDAVEFFSQDESNRLCRKINERLKPLQEVGLGYVQLGQSSSTLSGGEAQRIKLATFLIGGSSSTQTLFIFDEPTTGLHFHDVAKLLKSFNALIDRGHSIIVIEHNLDVIKCADWIIDIGPEGGDEGGNIVAEGTPEEVAKNKVSYTAKYLKQKLK